MTTVMASHWILPIVAGRLMAWRDSVRDEPPTPTWFAAIFAALMVVTFWPREPIYGIENQAITWLTYYLFGDHGRRWGRKAKQWAKAQLTAVQEAAWRRETAAAR